MGGSFLDDKFMQQLKRGILELLVLQMICQKPALVHHIRRPYIYGTVFIINQDTLSCNHTWNDPDHHYYDKDTEFETAKHP